MVVLTGRRHIVRWLIAGVVAFLVVLQLLQGTGTGGRTSGSRHLKDPVQQLKDQGIYKPPDPFVNSRPLEEAQVPEFDQANPNDASATREAIQAQVVSSTTNSWERVEQIPMATSTDAITSNAAVTSSDHVIATPSTSTQLSSEALSAARTGEPKLEQNAHRLPSADDFWPHFRALPLQDNLTVSTAMESCTWPPTSQVNFQYSADTEWVETPRNDTDIDTHRAAWQHHLLHNTIPYSTVAARFAGRGIVIVAGNERSLRRTFVLLRMLHQVGTILPVEIHHHGSEELTAQNKTDMKETYRHIFFSDLESPDQIIDTAAPGFINYNLKTAALLNSRFAEPLLLDSDNLPVSDPALLYMSATYKEYGTVFWPDIARTRPENPIWALTNTACRMDEYEQESGQLLVDKRKFWYHLQVAKWWSDQEYYNDFLLGDKDTFRFAWRALKTEYGRPKRWLTSVGVVQRPRNEVAFPDEGTVKVTGNVTVSASAMAADEERKGDAPPGGGVYCGHSFGQHFPDAADSPIAFLHGGLVKTLDPRHIQHARKYGGGLFAAYKESGVASEWEEIERVRIKWDGGSYLEPNAMEKIEHGAHCTDMPDVVPGAAGDGKTKELKGLEKVLEKVGVYWMVKGLEDVVD